MREARYLSCLLTLTKVTMEPTRCTHTYQMPTLLIPLIEIHSTLIGKRIGKKEHKMNLMREVKSLALNNWRLKCWIINW